MTSTEQRDPLADVQPGDNDPIGPFDPSNVCGKQIKTGANQWNTAECTREPHPPEWAHIATCDDEVGAVWFDGMPLDPSRVRLSHEGLVCVECNHEQTAILGENHFMDCPFDPGPHLRTTESKGRAS